MKKTLSPLTCIVCGKELKGKQAAYCCTSHQAYHEYYLQAQRRTIKAREALLNAFRNGGPSWDDWQEYEQALQALVELARQ